MLARWHVDSYLDGALTDSTAYATEVEADAAKARDDRLDQDLNAEMQADHAGRLRSFVMDEDTVDHESGECGLEPGTPPFYRYQRRVAPCRRVNCVACYEAGLIEPEEGGQEVNLLHRQLQKVMAVNQSGGVA